MQEKPKPTPIDYLQIAAGFACIMAIIVLIVVLGIHLADKQSSIIPTKSQDTSLQTESSPSSPTANPYLDDSQSDYVTNHGTDDCTSDCSGHDAGYEYADENEICDTEYSDGNSDSFNEGVIAWAEDNC